MTTTKAAGACEARQKAWAFEIDRLRPEYPKSAEGCRAEGPVDAVPCKDHGAVRGQPCQDPSQDPSTTCDGCACAPCRCAELDEQERQGDMLEAEQQATSAETNLSYLWEEGPDGILRRRKADRSADDGGTW